MAYGIVNMSGCQAAENDALLRKAVCATAIENGMVMQLLTVSATAGEEDVFTATIPSATAGLTQLWMAAEPPVAKATSGTKSYLGLNPDPRDARNEIGEVFTVFKPQIGDIVVLSTDALTGSKSTGDYVVATAADFQLNWAAAAVSGLSLKYLATTKIAIGDGTIAQAGATAYRFEVVAIA
jgi:hypothetical protein